MSALGNERSHMQGHRIVLVPRSLRGPLDTPLLHDTSREGLVLRRHTKPRSIQLGYTLIFHVLPLPISKHALYRGRSHTRRWGWRRKRLFRHVPCMRRRLVLLFPVHIALLSMHTASALKRTHLVHDTHTCTARYVHRRRRGNERGRRVEDVASLFDESALYSQLTDARLGRLGGAWRGWAVGIVVVVVVVGRLVAIRVALDQLLDDVFPCPVVRPQKAPDGALRVAWYTHVHEVLGIRMVLGLVTRVGYVRMSLVGSTQQTE